MLVLIGHWAEPPTPPVVIASRFGLLPPPVFSLRSWMIRALFTLTFLLFAAGATAAVVTPGRLLGEWRYADQIRSCRYHFRANGTFTGDVAYRGKVVSRFTGRWSLAHDAILYRYTSDTLGEIRPGTTDRDKLLNVGPNFFVIEAADGSKRKYIRLRASRTPSAPVVIKFPEIKLPNRAGTML